MQKALVWTITTRPKTLIASASPVLIGGALALPHPLFSLPLFLITLYTAVLVQIGTNFANDYYDHLKGSDQRREKGPMRGLHLGLLSLEEMKCATISTFVVAFIFSMYLAYVGGWPIFLSACLAPVIGVGYTKGRYALAYTGLGDPIVFLFFGPIAVLLTYYLQVGSMSWIPFIAGLAPGLLSTAILAVANLRDVDEDQISGKKTIPVRFGKMAGRLEYGLALMGAMFVSPLLVYLTSGHYYSLITLALTIPALFLIRKVDTCPLPQTAALLMAYTFLFCMGWSL